MTNRAFRFGVVGSPDRSAEEWQQTVRRAADLGYKSVLMPDGLQLLSPFPTLAVAAMTADIRVGTFVAAAPLRSPRSAAWDAHTLSVLTGGRFDFGIGTGRPQVEQQAAELGMPFGSAKERRDQVRETLDQLEKLDGDQRTPSCSRPVGPACSRWRPPGPTSFRWPSLRRLRGRRSGSLLGSCVSWPARERTTSSWP